MSAWRKKPVEVEAVQWSGSNWHEVYAFAGHEVFTANQGDKVVLRIKTLEGEMTAMPGDWVIKGVKGEFYPCKPDIFEATYEAAGSPDQPSYDELVEILGGVIDCAIWQSGAVQYPADSAWPEMREKLNQGLNAWTNLRPERTFANT